VYSMKPAATSSGPRVIGTRGPMRALSRPARDDSSSITSVTGASARPAASGENPTTRCSWMGIRNSDPPSAP
jgi:hypothetical protein